MKNVPEYYIVDELAAKLRVNRMTIYRYIKAGKLRAHKMAKVYRIASTDFDNFMKTSKT